MDRFARGQRPNHIDFQSPPEALDPLLPYLPQGAIIWEPCAGRGHLVTKLRQKGYDVLASDILYGQDFFEYEPGFPWEILITNPPWLLKYDILVRCYSFQKPFALLLPLYTLSTERRQALFKAHGIQLLCLAKQVHYYTPAGTSDTRRQCGWFCHQLLPEPLMFI